MKICWFSTGISSFIACYLSKNIDEIIYTHVRNQHPDSIRFLKDAERILNQKITILQSEKYRDVDDVIERARYVNGVYGAACTQRLKIDVRREWEKNHLGEMHTYVWGFDIDEKSRADRIVKRMPTVDHEFPLISHGLTKEDAHGMADRLGIRRPAMYELGYQNNNCIGCVKGGMWYWNKIRKDFPEVFQKRARQERMIGHSCIKGVFLDELAPDRGRKEEEIMQDCSILCQLAYIENKSRRNIDELYENKDGIENNK